jgi:lipopolysaccharide export system permease protein
VPARLWARTREGPVSIDRTSPDGRRLQGVRIYARDERGLIKARIVAAKVDWDGDNWQMQDVDELHIINGQIDRAHQEARVWNTNLRPADVLRLDVVRPRLSSRMLADVIAGVRVGSQPLSYYRTALYRSFTAPLGPVIMLLLALPTAYWLSRGGGGGREMLYALVLGLGFLLIDGMVASLGSSGRLPPLMAALIAPVLFTLIGALRLRACERL